jgi:glucose/arabinose dehydrogenase
LLRIRLGQASGMKVIATERLLQDTIGGIRSVAVGPSGAIYVATADPVAALTPDR